MTPEDREYHLRTTASMPPGDWHTAWAELYGYVSEHNVLGEPIDVAVLDNYMRELKRCYVTDPVKEWIKRQAK